MKYSDYKKTQPLWEQIWLKIYRLYLILRYGKQL